MTIRTITKAALTATMLMSSGGAFASHVVVFDARTEARTESAARQGTQNVGSISHWINGASHPTTFANVGGTASGGGSTTQTWAQSSQIGGHSSESYRNEGTASADLATGLLKATTTFTGSAPFAGGNAYARLDDTIYFTNTSGSTQTISFTYRFDGQMFNPYGALGVNPGGYVSLGLQCAFGSCQNGPNGTGDSILFANPDGSNALYFGNPRSPSGDAWDYHWSTTSSCFGDNGFCTQGGASLWDWGLNAPNAGGVVDGYIRAYLNIPTGQTGLGVRGILSISCFNSTCDFGNTGSFGFGALPQGVTYGSASGVFLTANAAPPGTVPEPATWAFMILGFGGIGSALRRRRRGAPAIA